MTLDQFRQTAEQKEFADKQIRYNLRFRWPKLNAVSDEELINMYDAFYFDDSFGNNDENLPKFFKEFFEIDVGEARI